MWHDLLNCAQINSDATVALKQQSSEKKYVHLYINPHHCQEKLHMALKLTGALNCIPDYTPVSMLRVH